MKIWRTNLDVSIVLPVFNERMTISANIAAICDRIRTVLPHETFEVLLVDNGSTDGTSCLEPTLPNEVRLLRVAQKGRGVALRTGFAEARGTFIAVLSIDRAWDEAFLSVALERLQVGIPLVYGPKSLAESRVRRKLSRRIGSMIVRLVVACLYRIKPTDTQCIKMFRKDSIPFLKKLGSYNYFAETEFFLRARASGIMADAIPVQVRDFRRDSKVRIGSFFEFVAEAFHFKQRARSEAGSIDSEADTWTAADAS